VTVRPETQPRKPPGPAEFRRVVVFGAGALGSLLGGKLASSVPVVLIGRKAHVAAIGAKGLVLSGLSNEHLPSGAALTAVESLAALQPGLRPNDLVLLTVKAAQCEEAGRALAASAPAAGRPVLAAFQNGTGYEEALRAALGGRYEFLHAVSHLGATLSAPGCVEDWGGEILVPETRAGEALEGLFRGVGQAARRVPNLEVLRWEKIAFNCALNPFCVLLDARNDETLEPEWRPLRRAVLDEARAEAGALALALPPTEELAAEFERRVSLSHNVNSMLQDFRRGRPTENPYLNGALARRAAARGATAPANAALADWIERLEAARGTPSLAGLRAEARAGLRAGRWEGVAG
jgi:2-dehydropantoate 2-reductase